MNEHFRLRRKILSVKHNGNRFWAIRPASKPTAKPSGYCLFQVGKILVVRRFVTKTFTEFRALLLELETLAIRSHCRLMRLAIPADSWKHATILKNSVWKCTAIRGGKKVQGNLEGTQIWVFEKDLSGKIATY